MYKVQRLSHHLLEQFHVRQQKIDQFEELLLALIAAVVVRVGLAASTSNR